MFLFDRNPRAVRGERGLLIVVVATDCEEQPFVLPIMPMLLWRAFDRLSEGVEKFNNDVSKKVDGLWKR